MNKCHKCKLAIGKNYTLHLPEKGQNYYECESCRITLDSLLKDNCKLAKKLWSELKLEPPYDEYVYFCEKCKKYVPRSELLSRINADKQYNSWPFFEYNYWHMIGVKCKGEVAPKRIGYQYHLEYIIDNLFHFNLEDLLQAKSVKSLIAQKNKVIQEYINKTKI